MGLWRSISTQSTSTSKLLQSPRSEQNNKLFQARRLLSMQSIRSISPPMKCVGARTAPIFPTRSGFPKQRLNRYLFPSPIHSTVFTRNVSWVPFQRGNINVQHVKFVQPKGRFLQNKWLQRIIIWLIVMRLMGIMAGKRSGDTLDTTKASQTTGSKIQDQTNITNTEPTLEKTDDGETLYTVDEENAWFLPLTWPRRKPSILYKASDEEWQEFCKLSKDAERQLAVKSQAVDFIHYIAKHHPQLKTILGTPSPRSRYWLDIDYPLKYDEGYESIGILITDEIIAIAARDYEESTVDRFRHFISAVPILSAVWTVSKAAFTGGETFTTATKKNDQMAITLPGVPDLKSAPELAKVLRTTIRKLQTRPRSMKSIPRGCVMVSGRVDVQGTKAWATFSMVGYYNPQKDAWAAPPLIGLGPIRPIALKPVG